MRVFTTSRLQSMLFCSAAGVKIPFGMRMSKVWKGDHWFSSIAWLIRQVRPARKYTAETLPDPLPEGTGPRLAMAAAPGLVHCNSVHSSDLVREKGHWHGTTPVPDYSAYHSNRCPPLTPCPARRWRRRMCRQKAQNGRLHAALWTLDFVILFHRTTDGWQASEPSSAQGENQQHKMAWQ